MQALEVEAAVCLEQEAQITKQLKIAKKRERAAKLRCNKHGVPTDKAPEITVEGPGQWP